MIHLLQAAEGIDLDGAVEQLSKSSIELAEAAANFGALKVIFGIFLVFCLTMIVMFFYQSITMARKVTDIHTATSKAAKMIEETSSRTLGKPQASILIRRAFNDLAQTIKYTILRTRIENHLDQKDYIVSKVTKLVTNEYQELNNFLMNYVCDDKTLAAHINIEDSKIIIDFVIEQLYLDESIFTISSMDQATDILMRGMRLEALKGIE